MFGGIASSNKSLECINDVAGGPDRLRVIAVACDGRHTLSAQAELHMILLILETQPGCMSIAPNAFSQNCKRDTNE